jgi:hypothetical protein
LDNNGIPCTVGQPQIEGSVDHLSEGITKEQVDLVFQTVERALIEEVGDDIVNSKMSAIVDVAGSEVTVTLTLNQVGNWGIPNTDDGLAQIFRDVKGMARSLKEGESHNDNLKRLRPGEFA